MPASFAPGQQEVELDRSPIYAGKNKNPVQRARRLGTGRRGDVASRVSMRLANHNGSLEPVSLDRRAPSVDWTVVQCGNMTVTLRPPKRMSAPRFSSIFDDFDWR